MKSLYLSLSQYLLWIIGNPCIISQNYLFLSPKVPLLLHLMLIYGRLRPYFFHVVYKFCEQIRLRMQSNPLYATGLYSFYNVGFIWFLAIYIFDSDLVWQMLCYVCREFLTWPLILINWIYHTKSVSDLFLHTRNL